MNSDTTTFSQFIKKHKSDGSADAEQKIQFFSSLVDNFYSLITEDWLKIYLQSNEIHFDLKPIRITEESLGEYYINAMVLKIGNKSLQFKPVGTNLIGTDARIDMIYLTKRVKIVHAPRNARSALDYIDIRLNGHTTVSKRKSLGQMTWMFVDDVNSFGLTEVNAVSLQRMIMDMIDANA